MTNATCSVTECDRPKKSRGWCQSHYMYWYTSGNTPTGPVRQWGRSRTTTCQVEGCKLPYGTRGYCDPHWKRVDKYGDPGPADIRPRSMGDDAGYSAVHWRLAKAHGKAANFSCVDCSEPAQQWAYDHADPNEKHSDAGHAYSVDLDHYQAMCIGCHGRFDRYHANAAQMQHVGIN